MSRDLRQLLHDTAVDPFDRPDPAGLVARGRRRRARRHALGAVAAVGATVLVAATVTQLLPSPTPQIVDRPTPTPPAPTATPSPAEPETAAPGEVRPLAWPDGPSQTSEDAAAQDVPAEVAALPLGERLQIRGGTAAPEGLYVTSGLPSEVSQSLGGDDGRLSDGTPSYVYEEVLLLDPDTLTVVRAWPTAGLSSVGAPIVLDDPDVVVVQRDADGGEPWSHLIVIERDSGVRHGWVTVPDDVQVDPGWDDVDWVETDGADLPAGSLLGSVDRTLAFLASGRLELRDPATLELVDSVAVDRPGPLRPVRGGAVVPEDGTFLRVGTDGLSPTDVPAAPGQVLAAVLDVEPPLALSNPDGLLVLEDGSWRQVPDTPWRGTLHTVDGRAYATFGRRLLAGATVVATRPAIGETGIDALAARPNGELLWIADDRPYAATAPSPTSARRPTRPPAEVTLPVPPDAGLSLGPDGVLVAGVDGVLEVLDARTGAVVRDLGVGGGEAMPTPAISDDGRWLFTTVLHTSCWSEVVAVDPTDGTVTAVATGSEVTVSPDGRRAAWVASPCDVQDLTVLDLTDGSVRSYPAPEPAEEQWMSIQDLAFSPDGAQLAYVRRGGPIVNGSLEPPRDGSPPAVVEILDLATADTLDDARTVELTVGPDADLASPVWLDPDTLWIVAQPGWWTETFGTNAKIVAANAIGGGPTRTVLERDAAISQIALDPTGAQLLWIETEPKVPGEHPQRDALWRLVDGRPTRLAADVAAADW